jgi:DNA invertase Pin-like site-specific DNA recombinase
MILEKKTEKIKRYVIYTRCSTDEQAMGDFTTLDSQAHHCKNMLDAFGYVLSEFGKEGVIKDDGYSAKDLNRPGIKAILESIHQRRGEFDGVIFFRLDRLTRNPRDLYAMIDLFKEYDIDFISVREKLDSATAIGRVVIGILGLLSAFERELTGERVKASFLARARQGMRTGGKVPIGYKLLKNGPVLPNGKQPTKLVIDETTAPHIKIIWEMAANNKSQAEIANELIRREIFTANKIVWRKQAIAHIIKNPFYKGYINYCGETHRGQHEALVEEKMWNKANKIMSSKTPGRRVWKTKPEYEHLLAGLIRCGDCGSSMVGVHSNGRGDKKFYYYECGRSRQGLGCSRKRVSATVFDQAILDYFRRASKDQEVIIRAIGAAIRESQIKCEEIDVILNEKRIRLNTLRHEADNLLNIAMKNDIAQGTTFKNKFNAIEHEITTLEEQTKKLEDDRKAAQLSAHSGEHIYQNIQTLMENIDQVPPEIQKNLLRALIQNIEIHDTKIVMNVYIQPEGLAVLAENEKTPTPVNDQDEGFSPANCGTVAPTGSVSQWRQEKGG